MNSNIVTKKCPKCGETKPVIEFFKCKSKKDGLQTKCKACESDYRAANPERRREYQSAYRAENAEKLREYHAAYCASNRDRDRERSAAWRAANPERMRELNAAWREANPERMRELNEAYYAANKDKEIARSVAWAKANPESVRIRNRNREARKAHAGGKLSKNITKLLMEEQAGKCACCLTDLPVSGHALDHVMPIALGGCNMDSNIQLLCPTCNSSKGAKHPLAWMDQKGIFKA
jgi:5-methylcytosine-specific restriction endonuclease McrA